MELTGSELRNQSIGEIAAERPGAAAIFREYGLDYGCGGDASLATAAAGRGVELAEIESALAQLDTSEDFALADTRGLIEHVLSRFHEAHRRELPDLIALAQRVEGVHADHPAVPKGLARFLERVGHELESHMAKEEQILFPMMRAGHPAAPGPISVMRSEHVDHGVSLAALAALTHNMQPPEDACGSWRALYTGVRKLSDDLVEHIHTENYSLFPRFES